MDFGIGCCVAFSNDVEQIHFGIFRAAITVSHTCRSLMAVFSLYSKDAHVLWWLRGV